jgi:cytochrome c oxidase subunit 4
MKTEVAPTHSDTGEHKHPGPGRYVAVAVILAIITGIEVLVYYQPSIKPILVPILMMSALKFALVVMFFMHLRYDNRLFSMAFVGPLALASAVMVAVLSIFHRVLLGV